MSHLESKQSREIAALLKSCKESADKIHKALAALRDARERQDLEKSHVELNKTYDAVNNATRHFIAFQQLVRETKEPTEAQEMIKAMLKDCALIEQDSAGRPAIAAAIRHTGMHLEKKGDRNEILQNFCYAITTATNENNEQLKGLRILMRSSSTPADSKIRSSSTSTATSSIQPSAEPKPDAMERTPSIVTTDEAKAPLQRERTARLAQRAEEIKAANARIDAAHQHAMKLLPPEKPADTKGQQPNQAEKPQTPEELALALTRACATLLQKLAKVPFTEPELPVEEVWNLLEDTIVSLSALQRLVRTIQDKEQAQLLTNAVAAQVKEGKTIQSYIKERNQKGTRDSDFDRLSSKLLFMMSNNLASDPHKMADGAPSQIQSEQKYLQGKVNSLLEVCEGWIKELNTIPTSNPAFTIAAIQTILKEATKDFADLQRKERRLRSLENTIAGLSEEERNLYDLSNEKHSIPIETSKAIQSDITGFVSYVQTRNQEIYKEEDHDELLKNFLHFKNTLFTDTIPQLGKPAEQKASLQLAVDSQRVIHTSTVSTANSRIQTARATLTQQLESSQVEPSISDVVATIRLIITNSMGIKALLDNEKVDEGTKKTIRPIWEDLQDPRFLTNLRPLLVAKFSKQQTNNLLDALRDNNLPLLLGQLPKHEPKEAKKGKLAVLTDMFKKKPGQSPAASPDKATPKPADNSPKDSDNSSSSSNSSNTGPKS